MKLERVISVFDIVTESLILEIKIDEISLGTLKRIFRPNTDDPNMYDPYSISIKETEEINRHLVNKISFDFTKNIYQLDCFTINEKLYYLRA